MTQPKASLITRLSVSDAIRLDGCELSLAFRRDNSFRSLSRSSIHAHIGNVIHTVSEEFAKSHTIEDFDVWFTNTWTLSINQEFEHYVSEIFPVPPRSLESWPNIVLKKMMLRTNLEKRWNLRGSEQAGQVAHVPLEGVEVILPSKGLSRRPIPVVYGRADAIIKMGVTPLIIDLKTGLSDEIGQKTRIQLALYAYLYHFETGTTPKVAQQDTSGERTIVPQIDEEFAQSTYARIVEKIGTFNDKVSEATFASTVSQENCGQCNFRVACDAFKSSELNEGAWWVAEGTVTSVLDAGDGRCSVRLRRSDGSDEILAIAGLELDAWLNRVGSVAAFGGLLESSTVGGSFRFREESRYILLEAADV